MSRYDDFLAELKRQHNTTAKTAMRRLYELLREEDSNMSKDDIYDRIMKDCLVIWKKETIQHNMPDELKESERMESGSKGGKKRQLVTVTNDGSVASDNQANHAQKPSENIVTNSNSNYETEKHQTYESNHNGSSVYYSDADAKREARIEELQLENGKLREQMREQKEQIQSLIKSVNSAAVVKPGNSNNNNNNNKESLEISSLKAELDLVKQERDELKQIESLRMKQNPGQTFQTASNIRPENQTVEISAADLSKFFIAARNVRQVMYITIQGNKVVSWESDAKRSTADNKIKAAA